MMTDEQSDPMLCSDLRMCLVPQACGGSLAEGGWVADYLELAVPVTVVIVLQEEGWPLGEQRLATEHYNIWCAP